MLCTARFYIRPSATVKPPPASLTSQKQPPAGNTAGRGFCRNTPAALLPFAPATVILSHGKTAHPQPAPRRCLVVQEHSIVDRETGNPHQPLTLPARINLESLADDRLQVKAPIEVVLFAAEGLIVAEAEQLYECGDGPNQEAAIADLQYALADLYFTLEREQYRLSKGMQPVWQLLQSKVARR